MYHVYQELPIIALAFALADPQSTSGSCMGTFIVRPWS